MMANPRKLLSQQDTVDNLTSTSSIYPLSANQGRVLQNEINNISGGGIVKADFSSNYNGLIYDMPFGSLDWEASSNQLKVSFDDNINSLEYITVSSSVKNRDINSNKQFLEVSGVINISASTSYYFSDDGLLNSSLNMDNEGDTTYLTVGFSTNSPNLTSYSLNLSIQRQQSGLDTIMINGLFLTNEISTGTFFGLSMEANGMPGAQQSIFSFGGRENPADVGVVIPFPIAFTRMSFTNADGIFDALARPIELVKNGIATGSIATMPAGSQRAVVDINPSVGYAAGDRLSFKRSGGSGPSAAALDAMIIGRVLL
jgi:hypothetical protein